jgi:hypothetical protein
MSEIKNVCNTEVNPKQENPGKEKRTSESELYLSLGYGLASDWAVCFNVFADW